MLGSVGLLQVVRNGAIWSAPFHHSVYHRWQHVKEALVPLVCACVNHGDSLLIEAFGVCDLQQMTRSSGVGLVA